MLFLDLEASVAGAATAILPPAVKAVVDTVVDVVLDPGYTPSLPCAEVFLTSDFPEFTTFVLSLQRRRV